MAAPLPRLTETAPPPDGLAAGELVVRDLVRRFGGNQVLHGVSFALVPGHLTALIGANGAGKSTLLACIAGTQVPDEGTVAVDGRDVTRLPSHERSRLGLATVFQSTAHFAGLTAWESVQLGAHRWTRHGFVAAMLRTRGARREEREIAAVGAAALERVGLGDRRHDDVASLPFGQQRMVAVARAIASRAALLLLDEPAAGLRAKERALLVRLLRSLRAEGMTQLLVEHDAALVMDVADRVIVLDEGRVLADGPPAEVRRDRNVIRAYLGESWSA